MNEIKHRHVPATVRRLENQRHNQRKTTVGLGLIVTNTAGNDGDDEEEQASSSPSTIPSIIVDTAAVVENPAAFSLDV